MSAFRPEGPATLPDHEYCTIHRLHKIGCHQYEYLLERSDRKCEICRVPSASATRGKLHIDHDHAWPEWAVRGLLCNTCNARLGGVQEPTAAVLAYLANAWWKQECGRLGVPLDIQQEPPIGSAIRDQFVAVWFREEDGRWRPHGRRRPGISWLSWQRLYELRGPQNMAVLDLATEGSEWLTWHADNIRSKIPALRVDA